LNATIPLATEEAFWKNVDKVSGGCWKWLGSRTVYAIHNFGDEFGVPRAMVAHRYLWTVILEREAPKGYVLHHNCENKLCVNPNHLELLTNAEHLRMHRTTPYPRQDRNPAELDIGPDIKSDTDRLVLMPVLGKRWLCPPKVALRRAQQYGLRVIRFNARVRGVFLSDILRIEASK
jgi:hypothetical protein